jgi:hypothetical protein
MKKILTVLIVLVFTVAGFAHPHFQKQITTKIGGNDVKISYFTTPANMEHLKNVQKGAYNPGYGTLTLSSEMMVGSHSLKAGDYTIGAIMNGPDNWSMALYEGKIPRGAKPDMSKVIRLESMFSKSQGTAEHVYFDIMPGHGKFEGKAVLIWHFGPLHLAGMIN